MAKVRSRYLNMDFEVNTFQATRDSGEVAQIISHDALVDIVHNQLPKELGTKYDCTDMLISDTHCVIRCTFYDASGRRVQDIGETTAATLDTEIARGYPATMASQRAFDRAAIRYLNLPGKVFSDLEGLTDEERAAVSGETEIDVDEALAGGESCGIDIPPANEPKVTAPNKPASAAQVTKPPVQQPRNNSGQSAQTPPIGNGPAAAPAAPAQAQVEDPGSVICDIGQFNNKNMTVAQVYEKNPGYIKWIVEKYTATNEVRTKIKNACAKFLEAQNGG